MHDYVRRLPVPYLAMALGQVTDNGSFMFGISSDKSEAAKALLYPHPSDADMQVTRTLIDFGLLRSTCWSHERRYMPWFTVQ